MFYRLLNDSNNQRALELLQEISHVRVTEVICPPGKAEYYDMPFIKSEQGTYFGLDDIRAFVAIQIGEKNRLARAQNAR